MVNIHRTMCTIISIFAAIVTILSISFTVKDSFFYNLNNLPEGVFVRDDFDQSILFSTGYRLRVYQVEKTKHFPSAVRVELCNDKTGTTKTIYWQTNTEATIISWSSGENITVTINGVPIDVENSYYDCRDYKNHIYTPPVTTTLQ